MPQRWMMRTFRRQCAPIESARAHSVNVAGVRVVFLPSTRIAVRTRTARDDPPFRRAWQVGFSEGYGEAGAYTQSTPATSAFRRSTDDLPMDDVEEESRRGRGA